MSKMSDLDIEVRELIRMGFTADEIHRTLNIPIEWVDGYREQEEEE